MASSMTLAILLSAKDQASAVLKGVEGQANKLGASILKNHKAIGMGMTAAGGAIIAAGLLSVKTYADMGDEVHKMALRTGFSTEALSEWRHAAELSGAELGSLDTSTKRMSKAIVDATDGMTTYTRAFDRIGLSAEDLITLKPEEQFDKIAMAIGGLENHAMKAATAQDIFGRAGTQLLPLLEQGAEGMASMRKEAHELGIVFDQEAANAAAKLTDDMTRMNSSLDGVKMTIASTLIPVLIPLIEKITTIIKGITEWMKEHPELAKVITLTATAIGGLLLVLGPLVIMLPGIISALPLVAGAFSLLLGPVGLVTAAVIALGAAFIYFKNKADEAKQAIIDVDEALRNSVGFELWPAGMTEVEKATARAKNAMVTLTGVIPEATQDWLEHEEAVLKALGSYEDIDTILGTAELRLLASAQAADVAKAKFMELSFVYPKVTEGVMDWAESEELALAINEEVTGKLKKSLDERAKDIKMALAKHVAETNEAIRKLRRTWDDWFRSIGPIAKQWDETGASAEDALQLMISMSGKTQRAIRDLFTEAGYQVGDFREKWADMAKMLGIDAENFISSLDGLMNKVDSSLEVTAGLGNTVKQVIASIGDEFKQTGSIIVDETNKLLGYANIVKARVLEAIGYGFGGLKTPGGYAGAPPPPETPPPGGLPTTMAQLQQLWSSTIAQHQLAFDAWLANWNSSLGFAKGGIVPGPIGQPQLAMVHGGETITPAGRGGSTTVNINGGTFLGNESEARKFAEKISKYLRSNQIAQFGAVRA